MRNPLRTLAVLFLSLFSAHLYGVDCPTAIDAPSDGIELKENAQKFILKNPAKGGSAATLCLLSESDLLKGHKCSTADSLTAPLPLIVGLCTAGTNNFNSTLSSAAIAAADAIIVEFDPKESGQTIRYLRLEAKDSAGKDLDPVPVTKITATAGAQNFAEDPRYKLWIYTGYTYLRTKDDFKDGYPEILARYETRIYDEGLWMQKVHPAKYEEIAAGTCTDCGKFPHFRVMRLYGETGLTGTAVVVAGDQQQQQVARVRQAFAGSVGVGWGWTLPVATPNRAQTNAFTVLGLARLGIITIPGVSADNTKTPPVVATAGKTAYNWMLGTRIENESGGNFEGKYFELGLGESEQFTRKKVPRLRADLFVPFPGDNKLFRFATRMQFDTPTPFNKKENADPSGEIRVSIILNVDMQEFVKRLGGK